MENDSGYQPLTRLKCSFQVPVSASLLRWCFLGLKYNQVDRYLGLSTNIH